MKKTLLFSILGIILLTSLVIGATIINKNLTIDSKLLDWASTDAKASAYTFTYTEKEMSDGSIIVCVNKDGTGLMKTIGCQTIKDSKLVDETEKAIVEKFLQRQKEINEYVAPTINKETTGELILSK